jgi:trehalose 6-phosphate phosphatase
VTSPDPLPELLAPLTARPERAGIFCDFDGTLAAIVDDPERARPVPGALDVLTGLATQYGVVAVVSGRPAAFLADRLGAPGLVLFGLYGLERVRDGEVEVEAGASEWRGVVEGAAARAEGSDGPGADVERKGLSVTLHFRVAPERERAVRTWVEQEARRTGLVVHPGRLCYELRPPLARDKGSVVAELAVGLDAVCFLGDDAGDLAGFDALDRLVREGRYALRVGVRSDEAPGALLARADVQVDGPAGVVELLRRLSRSPRP